MDSTIPKSWRETFDELVCAVKLAEEALRKPNLTETDREEIAEKITQLAELLAEVATTGRLAFDPARAAQIHEKIKEIEELVNSLIEKGEAL